MPSADCPLRTAELPGGMSDSPRLNLVLLGKRLAPVVLSSDGVEKHIGEGSLEVKHCERQRTRGYITFYRVSLDRQPKALVP